jgi:parallel beta-helix repeat protein
LSYYGGEGSVISNNDIHHLLKGFYSKNAGHLTIDGNQFHHNYLYGIDPHTGSHDLAITNNIVYKNNASGIICSKDCHDLLIEGNEVYENSGAARGIAFSINTTKSVAKNNYVHDQPRCISFNRGSDSNAVYNNTISNCKTAVSISGAVNNSIYDNEIKTAKVGILLKNPDNKIYNNTIIESKNGIVFEVVPSNQSKGIGNIDTLHEYDEQNKYLAGVARDNNIVGTEFPTLLD